MTITLAVDTAGVFGSIALADETGAREEVPVHAPQGFSYVLFSEIEALLKRQGLALEDVDLYAGASGPGSFTGVRVGLAAIKGLAEVMGKPVAAVSNLEALADFGDTNVRATVIDARRGEIYGAVYDGAGHQLVPESVLSLQRFLELLPEGDLEWISQGVDPGADFRSRAGCRIVEAPQSIAGVIAQIAIRRAHAGLVKDPAAIEANYVRRSDAELLWKEPGLHSK